MKYHLNAALCTYRASNILPTVIFMSKTAKSKNKQKVAKATPVEKTPEKNVVEREQFDKDGNLVCPTCKKSLRGLRVSVSDSLIAPDKHTTKRRKVQCCSEQCTAEFHEVQQKSIEE
jgi:hypothetical protein